MEMKLGEDVFERLEPGDQVRVRKGDDEYAGYVVNRSRGTVGDDEQHFLSLMPYEINDSPYNLNFFSEYDSSPGNLPLKEAREISESLDDLSISESPMVTKFRCGTTEARGSQIDEIELTGKYWEPED